MVPILVTHPEPTSTWPCEECHGTLVYPTIPQDQYQLHGTFGDYNPTFTSHESFTDTYILAMNGSEDLSIMVTGDNTSINMFTCMLSGSNNHHSDPKYLRCYYLLVENSLSSPIYYILTNPYIGTWIIKLASLQEDYWNYTYFKPIIRYVQTHNRIPECNDCHSPPCYRRPHSQNMKSLIGIPVLPIRM